MPAGRAEPEVYSVARLTAELKGLIESRYPSVWVEGELSNFRPHSSGHWYFTLKDADATLGGVMFRRSNARVRFRPQDGMHVRVFGAITVYPPQGKYQVLCELMEEQGVGALQRAFEELKRRLQAEGLFAEAHKAALPEVPSRVGVVTSPTGAALRDILNVLARRFPGLRVLIAPCRVQGDGAAEEIADAIRRLDARGDVDVMIVGRGGGSLEDLWAFNTEVVARAIHAARTPIISAVGHEADFTISDMVADLRAPTPSAAAELVCQSRAVLEDRVTTAQGRLLRAVDASLERAAAEVRRLEGRLKDPRREIQLRRQRLDDLSDRLAPAARRLLRERRGTLRDARTRLRATRLAERIRGGRSEVAAALARITALLGARVGYARKDVEQLAGKLASLDPYAVLERGYSIAYDAEGRVLRDASALRAGDAVRVRLRRGEFDASVSGTRKEGSR